MKMTLQESIAAISTATPIKCKKEEYPPIKEALDRYAIEQTTNGRAIYAMIALNEIKRLDYLFRE